MKIGCDDRFGGQGTTTEIGNPGSIQCGVAVSTTSEFGRSSTSERNETGDWRGVRDEFRNWVLSAVDSPAFLRAETASNHRLLPNFTVPVVLGGGKKLFADGSAPHSYKLTRSRISSTGLMIAHYERGGEVKVSDTAFGEPSKAEAARQERMKREG
jgi:hypothetical protein